MARRKTPPAPDCAKLFYRVAAQRMPEARWILEQSNYQFTTLAVYVAGYAVECALKAVLLANTPRSQHKQVKATFRGTAAHDFDWLRKRLRDRRVELPADVGRELDNMGWWTTDLRYETGRVATERADGFLDAAEAVVRWAKRSLT